MIKIDTSAFIAAMKAATAQVADVVSENSLRAIGFAGAEVFRDEAILNAGRNRRTGVIQKNIIAKRLTEVGSDTSQSYVVTVRTGKFGNDGDAFYWKWVENGHRFVRRAKNKQDTLKKRRVEALEFGTSMAPAYPFMRPAYESKKQEAVDAMTAKLAEKIKERSGT